MIERTNLTDMKTLQFFLQGFKAFHAAACGNGGLALGMIPADNALSNARSGTEDKDGVKVGRHSGSIEIKQRLSLWARGFRRFLGFLD